MRGLARRRAGLYARVPADSVPRPIVTSVSPSVGPTAAGTALTITGSRFTYPPGDPKYRATSVKLGGVACTSFALVSDTQITCVAPALAAGAVELEVVGPGGSGILAPAFTVYAAPAVSSVSPTSGDTAGGDAVTITGAGFTGATGATIGGVALTSFLVVNDTTITGVTGAHAVTPAPGVDVVVTGPGGTGTLASAFTYVASFDPATLSPTGWWRASYAGAPWAGAAGGDLTAAGSAVPATGAAVGGYTPADLDGVDDRLAHANDWSTFVSGTAGSLLVVFYADTAAVAAANTYDDPALVSDDNWGFNLGFSDGGISIAFYDGAWQQQRVACSSGAWHLAKLTWDGAAINVGIDNGAMTTLAAGTLQFNAGSKLTVGNATISVSAFFDGKILEVFAKDAVLSSTNINNFRSYVNARYGLAL